MNKDRFDLLENELKLEKLKNKKLKMILNQYEEILDYYHVVIYGEERK